MTSIIKVDQIQDTGGNNLVTSDGSGVITAAGFGKIGQVKQASATTPQTFSSTTYADVTNVSVSITPSSTSSKILVYYFVGQVSGISSGLARFRLVRGSTAIAIGDAAGNRTQSTSISYAAANYSQTTSGCFLDSPATSSATTYKLQAAKNSGTDIKIGRSVSDSDGASMDRTPTVIIVAEVLP
ncbi:hypothetical protein Lederberg_70 [Pelagibacter phage Lederberg EXVC029P]|nr:hypothetical protein Lederberg_70 [Pelagibacter phage Lederberg EXVC029P]